MVEQKSSVKIIKSQKAVGGGPNLSVGLAPSDMDRNEGPDE